MSAWLYVHTDGPQHLERRRGPAALHLGSAHFDGARTQVELLYRKGFLRSAAPHIALRYNVIGEEVPTASLLDPSYRESGMRAAHTRIDSLSPSPSHQEGAG